MVHRLPEDGGFPSKHVAVNKKPYCYVCQICIYWCHKWEIQSQCKRKNSVITVVYSWNSPQTANITYIPLLSSTHSNHRKDCGDVFNEQQVLWIGSHRTVKVRWKHNGRQRIGSLKICYLYSPWDFFPWQQWAHSSCKKLY